MTRLGSRFVSAVALAGTGVAGIACVGVFLLSSAIPRDRDIRKPYSVWHAPTSQTVTRSADELRSAREAFLRAKRASLPTTQPLLSVEGPHGLSPQHEWAYTWPHDEIPLDVPGFAVIDGPFADVSNGGRSASNWLRPVSYQHDSGILLRVWVHKDIVRSAATAAPFESWGDWERAEFGPITFHGVPAGIVLAPAGEDGGNTIYLAIRMNDRLFRIEAVGPCAEQARELAIKYAEALWAFRGRRTTSQPAAAVNQTTQRPPSPFGKLKSDLAGATVVIDAVRGEWSADARNEARIRELLIAANELSEAQFRTRALPASTLSGRLVTAGDNTYRWTIYWGGVAVIRTPKGESVYLILAERNGDDVDRRALNLEHEVQLFDAPVGDGARILVLQQPAGASILEPLLPEATSRPSDAVREVRVVLRGNDATVTLWAQVKPSNLRVLDLSVERGSVVMVSAEASDVFVTRIAVGRGITQTALLRPSDWSSLAAPLPLEEGQVEAEVRKLEDGRFQIVVTDHRGRQRTVFQQTPRTWRFEAVERSGGPPGTPQLPDARKEAGQ